MKRKLIQISFSKGVALTLLTLSPSIYATECVPYSKSSHQLVELRPGFHTVTGEVAKFDPCHETVKLSTPGLFAEKISDRPPAFIIVHGGGGLGKAELALANALNSNGIATLVFDAFQMNGYSRKEGFTLFLTGMSNEARQRMIYSAAIGAYEWLSKKDEVDTTRIFIHGLSNGGSVVANMAGAVSPKHVRAIFPEGASPEGLGFPSDITVPIKMIYGRLDNYAGGAENDWMFSRRRSCNRNIAFDLAPQGTSKTCSNKANPENLMISAEMWVADLKRTGRDIDIWFYDNAAHGIMAGPMDRGVRVYGKGPSAKKSWGWTGSDSDAKEKLIADLKAFVKSTY
jgi:dienelactone hydrolase